MAEQWDSGVASARAMEGTQGPKSLLALRLVTAGRDCRCSACPQARLRSETQEASFSL